jgi:Tat protein secretion system quality control protein TatD with DNase activity
VITAAETRLHSQLRADGATTAEARQVIELARQYDQVARQFGIRQPRITDLAYHPDQARGPHGRWIHSGQSLVEAAKHEDEIRDIASQTAIRVATTQDIAFDQRVRAAQTERDRKQDAQIRALQRQIRAANQHVAELESRTEGKKAKTKSLAVVASLIGGVLVGAVEAALGVPGLATALSSIAPAVIESMFEWKKRL